MPATAFEPHDHGACIDDALRAAEAHCDAHRLKLTPVRRRVLQLLLEEHRALGAYEILDRLRDEGLGSQPPVAYRALDFLTQHGFAHRIEGLNAFVACTTPTQAHVPAFLICRTCQRVVEDGAPPEDGPLGRAAARAGFVIESTVREATGLCPACAGDAAE